MRILVYEHDADSYLAPLQAVAPQVEIAVAKTPEEAEPYLAETEVLFAWGLPTDLLQRMPRLRWVQWLGAGVDRVIGVMPQGVPLTRVIGAFSTVMTEHVFAFLLAIRRGVFELRALQQEHRWEKVRATSLSGQRLGVAGLGVIGAEVVAMGRAFGMEVWGLSRSGSRQNLVDRHFTPESIEEFAAGVHNLVTVLPSTRDTDGLFSASAFAAMRPDSIFVNVGRGNAVDEDALVQALQRGRPGYAQLDVFRTEPLPATSPLWDLPNCFISSHCSGPSEARLVASFAAENLRRYLAGEALRGVVDQGRGY